MKRRASIPIVLVLMFFQLMASNMVHPVTPTFFKDLSMPTYLFGAAFAAMAVTQFLFCPFWGRLGDSVGRVRVLVFSTLGYAVGQLAFLLSGSVPTILLARMLSGLFAAGTTVNFMAYIADVSPAGQLGRNMSVCAAVTSAGTAAGYLVGGVIGDLSVHGTFLAQIAILCTVAAGIGLLLRDGPAYQKQPLALKRAANPFSAFLEARGLLTPKVCVFLFVVFASCFATTSYDNSFNYYIKDQFGFPPSYNGLIYAVVGLIGLIVNFTLGLRIQRRENCRGPLAIILALSGFTLLSSLALSQIAPFIALNMLFYVFSSMYLPLQQALIIREGKEGNGQISGVFSSVRAMGMIAGSLTAGFFYGIFPRLPLLVSACAFLLAGLVCQIGAVHKKAKGGK